MSSILIQRDQVKIPQVGPMNILGYTTTAGTTNIINSALSSATQGAGYNNQNLPFQVASLAAYSETCGWILDRIISVYDSVTKTAFTDNNGNEVYGKITKPSADYLLAFFSIVNGTETPFAIDAGKVIDFQAQYLFDSNNAPIDLMIRQNAVQIGQDPENNTKLYHENLTITALNTLSNLTYFPVEGTAVEILIDGGSHVSTVNGTISVAGKAITYNNTYNAGGYNIRTTSNAVAKYIIKK